jgi:glycosyltransferase involved in cell wall biosynthesis
MRILYICDALAVYGGLERVVVEKVNWLVEHGGCDVSLLTFNQGRHPVSFPLHPDVLYDDLNIRFYQQYHLPFWRRLIRKRQLQQQFRLLLGKKVQLLAPDVIVCTCLDYVRDVVKIKGTVPLVFESHASRLASRFEGDGLLRRLHVWYLQLAVKNAQMVVALTEGDAAEWRKLTPRVCVIPNVVHLNESGTYSDCTAKSAIFVGRFSKQKDFCSLLRIWSLVHQRHPDWTLHLYGELGDDQEAVLATIRKMNANVQVHEPTIDILERYKESSLLLLTSWYEPFGLVLPEAMSCGLPVVAFACPYGPADIIRDGVDGFLIRERSCKDFADSVSSLVENQTLRLRMGQAGILSAKRYGIDVIMPQWMSMLEHISSNS